MSNWNQLITQDSSSPIMEMIIFVHDHVMLILVLIISLISYIMISMLVNKLINRNLVKNHMIEIIWTVVPALMLIFIAFPSIYLLYFMEELNSPKLTVKILGHQWYWSYEYSDFVNVEFDSYILPLEELKHSDYRLLEVDNSMVVPYSTSIRLLISSTDVIHSWALPSSSIKTDAIPGRLNQSMLWFNRPGIFYGQCSEICGANHSFMPIKVESVSFKNFINWLSLN